MTKQTLETLKRITTWTGVLVTLSGVVINMARDGGNNITGHAISLVGLAITVCGHLAANALSSHQKAEKAIDQRTILELKDRLDSAEEILGNESLQRLVYEETCRYADEHQDDGR